MLCIDSLCVDFTGYVIHVGLILLELYWYASETNSVMLSTT
jgi:hypothetical protein